MSFENQSIFNPAIAKDIFTPEDYVQNPKFCYTHYWEPNDLIMWDNRVLLHRVIPYDYNKFRRSMIRGTVEGTTPVFGPFSNI